MYRGVSSCSYFVPLFKRIHSPFFFGHVSLGFLSAPFSELTKMECSRNDAVQCFSSTCKKQPQTKYLQQCPHVLREFEVFLFDCDGVLWLGNTLIKGVQSTLKKLRKLGKRIFFVSNNSTLCRAEYFHKFAKLGIECSLDEIISSSYAAGQYLKGKGYCDGEKKVYLIGESGLENELTAKNIHCVGGSHDRDKFIDRKKGLTIDPDIKAVVVGFDGTFNYYKLQYAYLCIATLDAEFIATNFDATSQTEVHKWAAGGSMVAALAHCSPKKPVIVGKPSSLLFEEILKQVSVSREKCVMVGDRLDTDIAFGKRNGIQTILVLTGVTTEEEVQSVLDQEIKGAPSMSEKSTRLDGVTNVDLIPHYIINSVGDFEKYL
ncbi:HAD hydrolase, family IIA protein [Cardiosporidium cionae]|uniref:HAD hydrolase, family IIA protein n=1 Tax=Cardiosporidium cionae TaxID=476202 RepID=A0ABQ7J9C7_9APIC|nr:HAD hydrolase, family IIA protein [Cardiosporidium cionae]|eukprot:KAF8820610.1 HAD hydrolase, family IIA protein [Cardiosporidium cionae]